MYWAGRRLSHAPFHGAAYTLIRRQIHTGSVLPGEQLPAERKLSETLGISRATLRDALKRLEHEGYITSMRGTKGGNFIAGDTELSDLARSHLLTNADTVWRSFEFLKALLDQGVVLACGRRNPAHLGAMRTALSCILNAKTPGELRKAQYDFLTAICDASLNNLISESLETALEGLFSPEPGPHPNATADALSRVLACIETEDAAGAVSALQQFFDGLAQSLLDQMMTS